ncbi:DUF4405 domain-containing protein [Aquirufa sp. LEPPI-3A]|uniref:DUF4405 domain-containing protein n=1 Tax=Aquirufa regiilacus TaxID=3024868 RepID=UPI0028DE3DB6|nr:DUF4405 domain-containing protein [Aquirufa sp. LEPPI-3A]MDT8887277.1 DUF4405 domain-containing protein [Aquirufa sp. LEPPI-3A]
MKNKNLISLTVALAFVLLALTGILLFVKQKAHFIEMTHTIFGLLFIGFAIFHILNNWDSIKAYSKDRKSGSIKKELVVASLITGIILVLSVTEVLEPVAEFGRIFASGAKRPQTVNFAEKKTLDSTKGHAVVLLLQKGKEVSMAGVTVEVADTTGKVLETLLAADKEMKGPPANLLLQTKIASAAPFDLIITFTHEGKSNKVSRRVQLMNAGVLGLEKEDGLIERAYLEIQ